MDIKGYSDKELKDVGSFWSRLVQKVFPGGYWRELKDTMAIGWALIISQMGQAYFLPVAIMFGGHLGKAELDAIGLANSLINVFGLGVTVGFSTALDTVFSQAFGAGNYEMVGIYFQKALIMTILFLLPCYGLYLNIEPILVGLGQDREVSRLVGQYMFYFMPGLFCLFMWTTIRKFTQCQNVVIPHVIIIILTHVVHAVLQYLFLYQFHLGIVGSSCAQVVGYFLLLVVTVVYTLQTATFKMSWGGLDKRCLFDWGELFLLGLYGIFMVCLERGAYETTVFLAGLLGTTELAAQTIIFNLKAVGSRPLDGIAVATSIRVAQLLGESDTKRAKTTARVSLSIAMINAGIFVTLYAAGRFIVPKIFTNNQDVIDMAADLMYIFAVFTLADSMKIIGRGVIRGAGKHFLGMVIIFIAYYMLGLPLAICLTFLTTMDIKGLLLGLTLAIYFCAIAYCVFIHFKFDWKKLADEAQLRATGNASGKGNDLINENEKRRLINVSKEDEGRELTKSLIIERILILIMFSSSFIAGIIARILTSDLYLELDNENMYNYSTGLYNSTMLMNNSNNMTTYY